MIICKEQKNSMENERLLLRKFVPFNALRVAAILLICFLSLLSSEKVFASSAPLYDEHDFSNNRFVAFDGKEESNPNKLMAHNIYSNPQLPSGVKGYNGFVIDFKADYAAEGTYWALCNWSMDTSCLKGKYSKIGGGGAYCGLQSTRSGKKAIMSFWNIECDDQVITPSLVYPVKDGNTHFSNEGSGANYLPDYDWKEGNWYRMFIECYEDPASKHTFVDMWVLDIEAGQYTRICCYDTKLTNSYFVGPMSQFMENYDYRTATKIRSFQYANLQVRSKDSNEWIMITKSKLSVDTNWGNKKGDYQFGSTSTNLWGITCGYGKDVAPLNADISSIESITGFCKHDQHSWDSGTVKTAPTYASAGTKVFVCTSCKEVKTESIPKLVHPANGFVERLYMICLGRTPDDAGTAYWVGKLTNKEISGADAAIGFFTSTEFTSKGTSNADFVEYLYQAFMDRESDPNGKVDWVYQLNHGMSRIEVCEGFAASNEFKGICAGYGIAATEMELENGGVKSFVTRLYRICLDREADVAGKNSWVNQLVNKEITGKQAAYGFVFSTEFTSHNYDNSEYIEYLYKAFLGRNSDPSGKAYWLNKMKTGSTREDIFNGFADSNEFGEICNKYGINRS